MKISEAKSAYYKQYQKFSFAASDVARKKEEAEKNARLHPDKADEFNKEAATLEISLEGLQKQADEYMKHNEKIAEAECAYANMIASEQNAEAMEDSAAEELKILETARRIMKGDIVPPQDEEKLMKYNFKLYMAAKNMGILAKEHEEDDSLWKDEEEIGEEERIDPMEYAGEQEAPEGGPSLDMEVSDVIGE
ncbi:MAG: hypothetical protein K6G75_03890 [Lachnospiraceae bacterium]|nr:hypothetical protein [Lachnospiraceae bacterium]